MSFASLKNHFLIAMPRLADPNFSHTVTYICEHNADGAMGIVINRLLDLTVGDVLSQLQMGEGSFNTSVLPVHWGGPVQTDRGFVLHEPLGSWNSTLPVSESIGLSTSRDILEAIARQRGPNRFLLALGYAGWGAGQLEDEIKENAWLHGPAQMQILFEDAVNHRWEAAAKAIGVDPLLLSDTAGHA